MTIAFAGGGTLGPVTPLLAVAKSIKHTVKQVDLVWFGTPDGPEKAVVEKEGFRFIPITVAKLPRHLDIRLFTFPLDSMKAQREAREALKSIKPDAVVTAGGFTGVPVVKEAAKLGIPCVMHQLDLVPGLSNRAVVKSCQSITTSFPYEKPPFGVPSTRIATPMRFSSAELPSREEACRYLGFTFEKPIVFVVGGGTGAAMLNDAIDQRIDAWLEFTQVLHVTGKGKMGSRKIRAGYIAREFLDAEEMKYAYAAADLIVTRAGIGALSEISGLSKPAIIVPIPGNQQEENAKAFHRAKAGIHATQEQPEFSENLAKLAKHLLSDPDELARMGQAAHAFFPTDDGSALAERVISLLN